MKTDASKVPNLDAVYPWFYETRPDKAKEYGVPFGGGTCMLLIRKKLGIEPDSWELLWDERLAGKVTSDSVGLVVDALGSRRDGRRPRPASMKCTTWRPPSRCSPSSTS